MEDFGRWTQEQFSILPLFDAARSSLPDSAGDLAIGVYALHRRARKAAWEKAECMLDMMHVPTVRAVRYGIALAQAANKGRLEQELAGMTFRVEALPGAAEGAILYNEIHPLQQAIGSVSGAYPPSFRVDRIPDAIRLYARDAQYIINPLDVNGMPQVTMQYMLPQPLY